MLNEGRLWKVPSERPAYCPHHVVTSTECLTETLLPRPADRRRKLSPVKSASSTVTCGTRQQMMNVVEWKVGTVLVLIIVLVLLKVIPRKLSANTRW